MTEQVDDDALFTRDELNQAQAAARVEGWNAAVAEMTAVLSNPVAKGREAQAIELFAANVPPDTVLSLISRMPRANAFEARMAAEGPSQLGGGYSSEPLDPRERGRQIALRAKGKL